MTEGVDNGARPGVQIIVRWRLTRFTQAPATPYVFLGYAATPLALLLVVYVLFHRSLESAVLGKVLHHSVFCFLWLSAWAVGPLLTGARTARDRRSRAWEALALSPVIPRKMAAGEMLGASVELWLLQATVLPLTGIGWILNAVSISEICLAWCCVLLNAVLCAGLGLWLASSRANEAQLLLMGSCTALLQLLAFGFGGSLLIGMAWPTFNPGWPFWLPEALLSAGIHSTWLLILAWLPFVYFTTCAWLAFESVSANMTHPFLDRCSGLRRWHLATSALVWTVALTPRVIFGADESGGVYVWSVVGILAYGWLCALIFARAPSERELGRTASRRGMLHESLLRCLTVNGIQLLAVAIVGIADHVYSSRPRANSITLMLTCLSTLSFLGTMTGLMVWLRQRRGVRFSRFAYVTLSAIALLAPVAAAATLMLMRAAGLEWFVALSPAASPLLDGVTSPATLNAATIVASFVWAGLGLVLWRSQPPEGARAIHGR